MHYRLQELAQAPADSLLVKQLSEYAVHHEDMFELDLNLPERSDEGCHVLLTKLLDGFLEQAPPEVRRLMLIRNFFVKPLGLRTSEIGCPVSSLLVKTESELFDGRFPVFDSLVSQEDTQAQVILGANDKHLIFRSCVGVKKLDAKTVRVSLGTRVHCKNWFGRFYMAVIDRAHRKYISPLMLKRAAAVLEQERLDQSM